MKIQAKLHPNSSKTDIIRQPDGIFEIYVTAQPIDGKANQQAIKLLSEYFDTAPSTIKIKSGLTSKIKIFEIME
jgi:uncharacterized protein YggU (UPF0235/DUF167 family)